MDSSVNSQMKNGVSPAPTILPGTERREAERSEADRSGGPGKIVANPPAAYSDRTDNGFRCCAD